MDKLIIEKDTDFPVQAKTFRFMQESYQTAITNLARVYGDRVILYGCEPDGGELTDGALLVDGEIIPFARSAASDYITITEAVQDVVYKTGEVLPAYYTRVAVTDPAAGYYLPAFRRVVIQTRPAIPGEWVTCTPSPNISVVEPIQVRVNERGQVEVKGTFVRALQDVVTQYEFLLPAGFYPAYDRIAGAWFYRPDMENIVVNIFANGQVRALIPKEYLTNYECILNFEYEL